MSILRWFEGQASVNPDSTAVVLDDRTIGYRDLQRQARRIGQELRRAGVQAGALVGVCLDRTEILPAALLGVWYAGAAYLPLDPNHPQDRLAFELEDARVSLILTEEKHRRSLPSGGRAIHAVEVLLRDSRGRAAAPFPNDHPGVDLSPDSPAYAIYTSGSTGRPKAALISHGALANTIRAVGSQLNLGASDVVLGGATVAFDVANLEFYLPLAAGASLRLIESGALSDGHRLARILRESEVTVMLATPTTYSILLEAGWSGGPGLQLVAGGEALPRELAKALQQRSRTLWNQYGPTETAICATSERVAPGDSDISLGRPLDNVTVYVLDQNLRPVPPGAPGEICIGGQGVGLGYLNRPELTQAVFLPDPFTARPGASMYRTGDLGRWRADGRLEFLGRKDDQIKIRGYRVELGEIECAMRAFAGVRDAAARAIEFEPGDSRLIAFLRSDAGTDLAALKDFLRGRLPEYMIPAELIPLDAFPVSPNGKVDRRRLDAMRLSGVIPAPAASNRASDLESDLASNLEPDLRQAMEQAPGDPIELWLQSTWRRLLKSPQVGLTDNFFDMGGHSLLAARMMAQASSRFGLRLPLSILLEQPTILALAEYVRRRSSVEPLLTRIQSGGGGPPLFIAHGVGGSLLSFRAIAACLAPRRTVYGLALPSSLDNLLDGDAEDAARRIVPALASRYVAEMRAVYPRGPYHLAGHSSGGPVVVEAALQLLQAGCEVGLLALLDCPASAAPNKDRNWRSPAALRSFLARNLAELALLPKLGWSEWAMRRVVYQKLKFKLWIIRRLPRIAHHYRNSALAQGYLALGAQTFQLPFFAGEGVLFVARDEPRDEDLAACWAPCFSHLHTVFVPGSHQSILDRPHAEFLAREMEERLARWDSAEPPEANSISLQIGA